MYGRRSLHSSKLNCSITTESISSAPIPFRHGDRQNQVKCIVDPHGQREKTRAKEGRQP